MKRPLLVLAVVVAFAALLGAPAPSAKSGQLTADEPQYLLSAISLAEDFDLDISDELAAERYRDFHAADLPRQTQPFADGREVSPHDPLLPAILAVPTALGGWQGARLTMAVMAGLLASLTAWVAIRRFSVRTHVAVVVVGALSVSAPMVAYGSQIYPELPAALATMVAVAGLTGPFDRRARWITVVAIVVLPWLAVKYTPVAAVLAGLAVTRVWRRDGRRSAVPVIGALVAAGLVYVWFHHVVYGGWTAYAAGDHFVDGELVALGRDPDPVGRSYRLVGLLTDRGFGLVAWAPVFMVVVAGVAGFVRRRPVRWVMVVAPLAVGWANATFVAESMHDWSWPGRQVVIVVPLAILAAAWWVDQVPRAMAPLLALTAVGLVFWAWLVVEASTGGSTFSLVVDLERTADPLYRAWRTVLPDYRIPTAMTPVLGWAWTLGIACISAAGARLAGPSNARRSSATASDDAPARQPASEEIPSAHKRMELTS